MTVTATVAEWFTLPAEPLDVPVIVTLPVIGGFDPEEQPAKARRSTTVVARPIRTRSPLAFGNRKSNSNARIRGAVCGREIGGVRRGAVGRVTAPFILVTVTCTVCAVFPSEAVTGPPTVQVVPVGAPVQVNPTL